MKAMLLAAGKGERMRPLTDSVPKPLLKVAGSALIVHLIRKLAGQGFTDLVINHAWLGAQLETELGNGRSLGVRIAWSREGEPLETAGGIVRALPLLGSDPFLVVNADLWTDYRFANLRSGLRVGDLAHLVLVPNPAHHPAGDFTLDDKRRLQLPSAGATLTFSGIAVYHPRLFVNLADGKLPLLPQLRRAIAQDAASGEVFEGEWVDVGTPERLAQLDARLRQPHANGELR
jgi:MurNAc alpha-1-phosphate uridylyltransferase